MSLYLSQLVQPQGVDYWRNYLLQALQGIGLVTQAASTPQILGTGTVTVSGPAIQDSSVVVEITTSGQVGTGQFEYSTDGGVTFGGPYTIPAGATTGSGNFYIAALGITLTFQNGSFVNPGVGPNDYFVAGETYSLDTFTPTFPISNWAAIAPSWNLIKSDAQALADLNLTETQVAYGGFTQSWITPDPSLGPPPDGYCDILSQNFYNRFRIQGLATQGTVVVANSGGVSQTINARGMLFASATGQQFTNTNGGTVSAHGTLSLTIEAVTASSSYNSIPTYDPAGLIPGGNYLTSIVSPTIPGLSVTNPINSTPACIHTGTGPASIGFTGTATEAFSVIFRITKAGALGTSTYAYSLDGGNIFTDEGATTGSGVALNGMTVSFSAGTYVFGDTYSFSTGWITRYGSDTQTSLSLATADQNQWAELSPASKPEGAIENWAKTASPEVVDVFVTQSQTVPGQLNVLLIGPNNGPVSNAAIAAVTSYITPRLAINDSVLVMSVFQVPISVTVQDDGGTILYHQAQQAQVFAGVAAALSKLQATIPPGGIVFNSAVLTAIERVAGVISVEPPLWLNGAQQDIPLIQNAVALIKLPPTNSYTPTA